MYDIFCLFTHFNKNLHLSGSKIGINKFKRAALWAEGVLYKCLGKGGLICVGNFTQENLIICGEVLFLYLYLSDG